MSMTDDELYWDMRRQRDALRASNAELLAVLEAILHPDNEAIVYFVPSDAHAIALRERARAAIAAAKGGA